MQHKRTLALILAVALLLGCGGYVPAVAVEPVWEEAAQQAQPEDNERHEKPRCREVLI